MLLKLEEKLINTTTDGEPMRLTRVPEVEHSLLKCDLGGWDKDEEADPVKGAEV